MSLWGTCGSIKSMRMLFHFLLIFLLTATHSSGAFAAVKARLGAHDEYSRLVFEWDKPTFYSLEKSSPGTLKITFKNTEAGTFNAGSLKDEIVSGVKILSEKPLSVEITIPKDATSRDFTAGGRVIIDVYAKRTAKVETKPDAKPEVKVEKPVIPEAKPKQAEVKPAAPVEPPKTEPAKIETPKVSEPVAATPSAPVTPTPATQAPAVVPAEKEALPSTETLNMPVPVINAQSSALPEQEVIPSKPAREKIVNSNQINVTTTKAIGMALMRINDEIWLVSDDENLLINPQVKGADAAQFQAFYQEVLPKGKLFKTSIKKDAEYSAQGGGLLWRILVSPEKDKRKSVTYERKSVPLDSAAAPTQSRGDSILYALKEPTEVLDIPHPVTKRTMKVITVRSSDQFINPGQDFVDFTVLPTLAGMAIIPKVDDLTITIKEAGVVISRPGGLTLLPDDKIAMMTIKELPPEPTAQAVPETDKARIFDFQTWKLGTLASIEDNKHIILTKIGGQNDQKKMEGLLNISKMYLSHGMWAEALGYLEIVEDKLPDMGTNASFMAIKGAAEALGYKSEEAFHDLSIEGLKNFEEVNYWRAYALADLGDWQQAETVLPNDFKALSFYPSELATRLSLVLTEISLRAGDQKKAEVLLDIATRYKKEFNPKQKAYFEYLNGEMARQKGKPDDTKKLWEPLVKGPDALYRAKGGLAMTRMNLADKKITQAEAIDSLERLRYVWRGDELETQINYWLGKTYFDTGQYLKGLNILREAANADVTGFLAPRIKQEMGQMFIKMFSGADIEKISPVDVAAIYEQFADLVPAGPEGNMIVERLAERLVQADLLERAEKMLQIMFDSRLEGTEIHRVGVKLAAVYLLDKKPDQAQAVLDKALKSYMAAAPEYRTPERQRELALLMARAMSQKGRAAEAGAFLQGLDPHPDLNRLRADIAWRAGQWSDAAAALGDVIVDQNVVLTRPLSEDHTNLILQRGLAMNLASDRAGLANLREKYGDAMAATPKARSFEIISRPRQSAALADRQTLMGIVSEVDLFSEFLNSYKAPSAPVN